MQAVRKFIYMLGFIVFLGLVGVVLVNYWGYIFSKTIDGQVFQIERITQPTMLVTDRMLGNPASQSSVTPAEAMYSFAVAIRTKQGEIYTASSEDRQWAVAQRGICVEAKFYPYPPWNLEAGGTYRNARLIAMKQCPPDMGPLPDAPALPAGAAPAVPTPPPVQDQQGHANPQPANQPSGRPAN